MAYLLLKDKRGMFFTMVAVVLISLFLIVYSYQSVFDNSLAINSRISTLDNFVFSMEQDLSRQLYIAGYRAIFIFERDISENGQYTSDINSAFNELFFNGTFKGVEEPTMLGATYEDIKNSAQGLGRGINLNVLMDGNSIKLTQEDPWNVKVTFDTELYFEDTGGLASWNKSKEYTAYIPLDSFEDPIYTVSTSGLVLQKINKSMYLPLTNEGSVANLSLHNKEGLYIASPLAPSFLNRLTGNFSADPNGIESLVYLPKLSAQDFTVMQKSCVDYIYFSNNNPPKNNIVGMPSWFYLDSAHLSLYNVTDLVY